MDTLAAKGVVCETVISSSIGQLRARICKCITSAFKPTEIRAISELGLDAQARQPERQPVKPVML